MPDRSHMEAALEPLAGEYLELVLAGQRRRASETILEAVERGTSVKQIYLGVFQPVLREVGRLWQENQISVAQEHLATAVTQLVISQLYPRIFAGPRRGRVLVATCLGGELHEVGVRMVADFFEMAGWDTYYLGASTPEEAIIEEARRVAADLIGLSITLRARVDAATALVQRARGTAGLERLKIMVGGLPLLADPDLWRAIGADGTAPDAEQAVALGEELLK